MFDLDTFIRAAQAIGPVLAQAPAVAQLLEQAKEALHPADQAVAKEALADLIADNDDGHRRVQEKLAAAAKR
jgi:pantothenate kinase type III